MELERRTQLSESGQRRRDAMLEDLIGVMHDHHERRRTRRNVITFSAVATLVLGTVYLVASASSVSPASPAQLAQLDSTHEVEAVPSMVRIARVETEPGIADRYRAEPTNTVLLIDDTELLETLQLVDRPAGLVRMGDEVFVTASVTDQPGYLLGRPNSL